MLRPCAIGGRLRVIIVVLIAAIKRLPERRVLIQLGDHRAVNYRVAGYFYYTVAFNFQESTINLFFNIITHIKKFFDQLAQRQD